mgnify:CR=1 FL=1
MLIMIFAVEDHVICDGFHNVIYVGIGDVKNVIKKFILF